MPICEILVCSLAGSPRFPCLLISEKPISYLCMGISLKCELVNEIPHYSHSNARLTHMVKVTLLVHFSCE